MEISQKEIGRDGNKNSEQILSMMVYKWFLCSPQGPRDQGLVPNVTGPGVLQELSETARGQREFPQGNVILWYNLLASTAAVLLS